MRCAKYSDQNADMGETGREDRKHHRALSGLLDEGLKVMATSKLLFDTLRFTIFRRNDGSIEIAPKGDPKGTRVFHRQAKRYESELALRRQLVSRTNGRTFIKAPAQA
jgi:hypothetical protein